MTGDTVNDNTNPGLRHRMMVFTSVGLVLLAGAWLLDVTQVKANHWIYPLFTLAVLGAAMWWTERRTARKNRER